MRDSRVSAWNYSDISSKSRKILHIVGTVQTVDLNKALTPHAVLITPRRAEKLASAASAVSGNPRQRHGFEFQSAVCSLLGLFEPENYTHPHDAYDADPDTAEDPDPYSLKAIRVGGNLELGSLARQAGTQRDFKLCVALWKPAGSEKEIQSIHAMHVPADYWRSLWPANISPFLAEAAFDGISNSPADDERWALRMAGLQETWQANLPGGSPAKLHLKRDHSQQRRVQCSISREGFNELFQLTYDPALTDRLKEALDA